MMDQEGGVCPLSFGRGYVMVVRLDNSSGFDMDRGIIVKTGDVVGWLGTRYGDGGVSRVQVGKWVFELRLNTVSLHQYSIDLVVTQDGFGGVSVYKVANTWFPVTLKMGYKELDCDCTLLELGRNSGLLYCRNRLVAVVTARGGKGSCGVYKVEDLVALKQLDIKACFLLLRDLQQAAILG